MREINIDVLIKQLEQLKSQGETVIQEDGTWENGENMQIDSIETILSEFGNEWFFD